MACHGVSSVLRLMVTLVVASASANANGKINNIDVIVDDIGTYRVLHDGAVLLESAEAGPCGVQHEGQWCKCRAGAMKDDAGVGEDQSCFLTLQGLSSSVGSDNLGAYNRTEMQWGIGDTQAGPPLLVAAVRVYVRRSDSLSLPLFPFPI